ncbi:cathepsin F [Paragonimus westermani]|uniref:Cathepsin F n=1 Tax=Paragonimus westermani TaxID=34504 RepID=A0A5J4NA42_9TREM|nr:cathepsin F [Paragonimus westermani]
MRLLIVTLCLGLTLAVKLQKPTEFLYYRDPDNARELYEEFKRYYNKRFSNDDDEYRFTVFKNNLMRAELYQTLEQGTATYGITQFSDLTAEEFRALYANANMKNRPRTRETDVENVQHIPDSVDWRSLGAVNPVEQQGACGSCWAFSTIGNVEGQWFRKTGDLIVLSKQQLVDCDRVDEGCNGGFPMDAYNELRRMGGVEAQRTYPYTGRQSVCRLDKRRFVAYLNDSVMLPKDEMKQAAWLADNGPLSVALNADQLQFYRGGISHPPEDLCPASGLNHAVLSVGYGSENGTPYWIIKNSWGTRWGEKVS